MLDSDLVKCSTNKYSAVTGLCVRGGNSEIFVTLMNTHFWKFKLIY